MREKARSLLVACFAIILLGCGSSKLDELSDDDVIIAFGDSLTAGVGTSEQHSYPSVLAELTGMNIVNAGVSGETTREGLIRLPEVIEEHDPSLILLLEGGNDILRNEAYERIERNLDQMIEIALDWGIQVVLIGVPEKRLFSDSAPFYRNLAEKYDLAYEPELIGRLMRSPSMKSDSIHFNKEGYAEMAESIRDLLSEHGAIK